MYRLLRYTGGHGGWKKDAYSGENFFEPSPGNDALRRLRVEFPRSAINILSGL